MVNGSVSPAINHASAKHMCLFDVRIVHPTPGARFVPFKLRSISVLLAISTALAAQSIPQPTSASTAATRDTSYVDPQGTAYVTRVVPVPPDLSPEARKSLIRIIPDQVTLRSLSNIVGLEWRRRVHARTLPGVSSAPTRSPNPPSPVFRSGSSLHRTCQGITATRFLSTCMEEALTPTRGRLVRAFRSPATRESKSSQCCIAWLQSIHFQLE